MFVPRQAATGRDHHGFTLIELIITMMLSTLVMLGLVQIASAASASTRLQRNQAQIQEHARHAANRLASAIRQAGFTPEPWNENFPAPHPADDSLDNLSTGSDRLSVRSWSDLNCFDNLNPDTDSSGTSLYYIRESVFDLNSTYGLTQQCRYGPSLTELTTQISRQGFIEGVESFQVLYGQDSDGDGNVDGWVKAGQWSDPQHVRGIRLGLLLSSQDAVKEKRTQTYDILDATISRRADGKLRRAVQFTVAIRGRTH